MNERPIIFSGPMVRAILEGRKTQTRRVVKASGVALRFSKQHGMDATPRPATGQLVYRDGGAWDDSDLRTQPIGLCPYGKPGDRLWVRESFQPLFDEKLGAEPLPGEYDYKTGRGYCVSYPATDGVQEFHDMGSDQSFCARITPSIHMPRWASRITLEITEVRVQRLQEVTPKDCIAEGIEPVVQMGAYQTFVNYAPGMPSHLLPRDSFHSLWESINGLGSWDANPWVWAITFKPVEQESAAEKGRAL